ESVPFVARIPTVIPGNWDWGGVYNFFASSLDCCLTPSPYGHSPPYISLWKHRGRGLKVAFQFRYKDTLCTFPLCCVSGMGEGVEI
ncbi:hypothetical protein, partial [Barnesiella intestinihominis]|uniref:hypothetical protein n=1 Tax=Barnesiella intestinihominis TaxID=487174 RepID=UPI003967032F